MSGLTVEMIQQAMQKMADNEDAERPIYIPAPPRAWFNLTRSNSYYRLRQRRLRHLSQTPPVIRKRKPRGAS